MANLSNDTIWADSITAWDTITPALAGDLSSFMNAPLNKLSQRTAYLKHRTDTIISGLGELETIVSGLGDDIDTIDTILSGYDTHFDTIDSRLDSLEAGGGGGGGTGLIVQSTDITWTIGTDGTFEQAKADSLRYAFVNGAKFICVHPVSLPLDYQITVTNTLPNFIFKTSSDAATTVDWTNFTYNTFGILPSFIHLDYFIPIAGNFVAKSGSQTIPISPIYTTYGAADRAWIIESGVARSLTLSGFSGTGFISHLSSQLIPSLRILGANNTSIQIASATGFATVVTSCTAVSFAGELTLAPTGDNPMWVYGINSASLRVQRPTDSTGTPIAWTQLLTIGAEISKTFIDPAITWVYYTITQAAGITAYTDSSTTGINRIANAYILSPSRAPNLRLLSTEVNAWVRSRGNTWVAESPYSAYSLVPTDSSSPVATNSITEATLIDVTMNTQYMGSAGTIEIVYDMEIVSDQQQIALTASDFLKIAVYGTFVDGVDDPVLVASHTGEAGGLYNGGRFIRVLQRLQLGTTARFLTNSPTDIGNVRTSEAIKVAVSNMNAPLKLKVTGAVSVNNHTVRLNNLIVRVLPNHQY